MSSRPNLIVLPGHADRPRPEVHFCGHCGRAPEIADIMPASRVCDRCGLGLLLTAPAEAAPSPADPFLLIDGTLSICAVSRLAEGLLHVSETEAVNRHVTDLLVPADAEASGPESLVNLVVHAARGEGETHDVVLRPADEFGIRFWARVGPCGPPRAALLVLADGRA
jgi:hypothetical protein